MVFECPKYIKFKTKTFVKQILLYCICILSWINYFFIWRFKQTGPNSLGSHLAYPFGAFENLYFVSDFAVGLTLLILISRLA